MTGASRLTGRLRAVRDAAARAGALPLPVAIGFAVGFALLLGTNELAVRQIRDMQAAAAWVSHTQAVISGLAGVREAIVAAGADARGHALAGDAVPASGVTAAIATARRDLRELRTLTADNATQQLRLDSLDQLITVRVAILDSTLALGDARGPHGDGLAALVRRGEAASAEIKAVVGRAVATERALLADRSAREDRSVERAEALLGLGLATAAGVAALCVVLARRAARRQAIAEQQRDDAATQVQLQSEELEVQNEELLAQTDELERQATRLRGVRDYLRAVFEHLADGLIAFDERGRPTVCNPSARRLLGVPYTHSDARALEWCRDWLAADGRTPIAADTSPITRLLAGQDVDGVEIVVAPRTTGERRTLVVTGRHVRDESGAAMGSILALHDITDRKAAERLKNELVSVVSHELRTPLTSIRGSLGLLDAPSREALPPRAAALVAMARRNTDRLIRLVNDLLDLEKLEAAGLSRRDEVVRVGEAASAGVESVRGFAEQQRVTVHATADAEAERAVVRGDRERLAQVVTNLLSNAVKFSPAGGTVELRVTAPAGAVRVAVRDRGPGIAPHDLPRLFGKFQQLDSSDSRRHGGTGLGLAISKGIVEEHGGRIGVHTEPGDGAEFWFELPLAV